MKDKIIQNIDNPEVLEQLYRADSRAFSEAFMAALPSISDRSLSIFWETRLRYDSKKTEASIFSAADLVRLIAVCLLAGLLIKIPQITGFDPDEAMYYPRNAGLIVFFCLSLYAYLTKSPVSYRPLLISLGVLTLVAAYINLLPGGDHSHTLMLAYIHLPFFLWAWYGLVYIDFDYRNLDRRLQFIRHNGSLAILIALLAIAGGFLTAVTIGLFSAIGISIETFYFENIVIWGLVSVPVVATFIVRVYPFIAKNIAPVIAQVFSPLVLITLLIYLVVVVSAGKNPYHDRDFLLIFNLLLLGVMAIIVFSVAEIDGKRQGFTVAVLLALTATTLVIDMIALSAIVFRLAEFGFSPNRLAVLGSNLLVFVNLAVVLVDLFRVISKRREVGNIEESIAAYLPWYFLWSGIVVFLFPLFFGFR